MHITLPGSYNLGGQGGSNAFTDALAKWITDLNGSTDNYGKNAKWISKLFGAHTNDSTNSAVTESNSGISVNQDGSISTGNLSDLDSLGIIGLEALAGGVPEFQRLWSSAENQKARDWETEMSNSAYQRQMADMKAAGLNPILAYQSSSGASTPSASVTGSANSGSSLGATLSGISNIISTVMKRDIESDKAAFNQAKEAHRVAEASARLSHQSSAISHDRLYKISKSNYYDEKTRILRSYNNKHKN